MLDALARARANIRAWAREAERGGLDAILVTTSGCGTVIKDYGYLLREDRDFAGPAAKVSGLAKDITEYVASLDLPPPPELSALPPGRVFGLTIQPDALLQIRREHLGPACAQAVHPARAEFGEDRGAVKVDGDTVQPVESGGEIVGFASGPVAPDLTE